MSKSFISKRTTMKFNHLDFSLLLVLFLLCKFVQSETAFACISKRRILHEPLFPGLPLVVTRSPLPPESSDHPFFNEVPPGSSSNQNPPPPLSPPLPIPHSEPQVPNKTIPLPVQVNQPTKKVAIAVSVGIVTLGMLSALAFFLYRHRARHTDEPHKVVRGNSRRDLEESRMPPPLSDFLYIGTVEPVVSRRSVMEGENGLNESPYHKLKSIKRADCYRPSPDLQPLPPLTREINRISSSSAMFSSDDESLDMFYTPQRNADGAFTPVPCQNYPTNDNNPASCSAPHSKRASPKSRLAVSSPDIKCTFIPPIKKPPQPPLPPPLPPPRPLHIPTPRPPVKEHVTTKATSSLARLDADDMEGGRPRLMPLHWDKVRAASDRTTVWDQLNSSNFQLNEDMMETLFGCNSANSDPKEARRKMTIPPVGYEIRVLDPKKSQNIAILLRALNVTKEEVSEALLDGNTEHVGVELLETLVKMAPTKEEEIKLQEYKGNISLLGSAERFLKGILDIPFAFKRVEAMLYKANFETEVNYLRKSYKILKAASEELKNSRLFFKLLEAVLKAGNRMNVGTNRGDARAFKLDTLLKLVDVKATDGKTTLLHFVVQELTRSEGAVSETENKNLRSTLNTEGFKKKNLQVVAGLSRDLGNVKMAAGMDSDALHIYVSKLETGLAKIRSVFRYEKPSMQGKFFDSMNSFIRVADKEILLIKDDELKALSLVKEATEYFHGDSAKEEAHPLRIFMIVRDFLSILDNVCKEVGRIQDRVLVGSARSCQISTNASLSAFNRYTVRPDEENQTPCIQCIEIISMQNPTG